MKATSSMAGRRSLSSQRRWSKRSRSICVRAGRLAAGRLAGPAAPAGWLPAVRRWSAAANRSRPATALSVTANRTTRRQPASAAARRPAATASASSPVITSARPSASGRQLARPGQRLRPVQRQPGDGGHLLAAGRCQLGCGPRRLGLLGSVTVVAVSGSAEASCAVTGKSHCWPSAKTSRSRSPIWIGLRRAAGLPEQAAVVLHGERTGRQRRRRAAGWPGAAPPTTFPATRRAASPAAGRRRCPAHQTWHAQPGAWTRVIAGHPHHEAAPPAVLEEGRHRARAGAPAPICADAQQPPRRRAGQRHVAAEDRAVGVHILDRHRRMQRPALGEADKRGHVQPGQRQRGRLRRWQEVDAGEAGEGGGAHGDWGTMSEVMRETMNPEGLTSRRSSFIVSRLHVSLLAYARSIRSQASTSSSTATSVPLPLNEGPVYLVGRALVSFHSMTTLL